MLHYVICFCNKVTYLVDDGKVVDIFYLDFKNIFDPVSQNILLEKLLGHGFNMCTLDCLKNWLDAQPSEW